jgi:hypothetical protein
VPISVVTSIESDCSEECGMTELTPIMNSVHKTNGSLQGRRVPLSVVTSIESDCSEESVMTEMTQILNSVDTSNDSLH